MKKNAQPGLEQVFAALADRTRLRLLNLLMQGEICVCYFTAIIRAPQPTISRHLAYLRRSGLVETRRDGKWIHYRAATAPGSPAARVMKALAEEFRHDPQMNADVQALQNACCAPRLPRALADAPRPSLRAEDIQ
jgi:ArsR family transcriptional regulator